MEKQHLSSSDRTYMNDHGFTLVELMVVIVIIGILATSAVLVFSNYQKKARNSVRVNDLEEMRGAVERYKANRDDTFAPNDSDFANFQEEMAPLYLQKIPNDPGNKSYQYTRDISNYSDFYFGGFDELLSVPGTPAFLKRGPSPMAVEADGTDGDPVTTPTNGMEFGY